MTGDGSFQAGPDMPGEFQWQERTDRPTRGPGSTGVVWQALGPCLWPSL